MRRVSKIFDRLRRKDWRSLANGALLSLPGRSSRGQSLRAKSPPNPAAVRRMAGSWWCSGTLPSPTEGIMPKSTTPKLNDTQLIILSSASQSEAGLAVLPESLKASAAKAAMTKLLGLGFLKEVRVKRDQPAWRADEEDKPLGLKITKAGSAAIGVANEGPGEDEPAPEPKRRRKPKQQAPEEITASREPRPGSKQAQIIALMR